MKPQRQPEAAHLRNGRRFPDEMTKAIAEVAWLARGRRAQIKAPAAER
jgi:hypothetical protein